MKTQLAILFLLISIPCFAQKIVKSEYDKFMKVHKIETNNIDIRYDPWGSAGISFRSAGEPFNFKKS